MKTIDETIRSVLEKRDIAEAKQKRRKDAIEKGVLTLGVAAAFVFAGLYLSDFQLPFKMSADTTITEDVVDAFSGTGEYAESAISDDPLSSDVESSTEIKSTDNSTTVFSAETTNVTTAIENAISDGDSLNMCAAEFEALTEIFIDNSESFNRVANVVTNNSKVRIHINDSENILERGIKSEIFELTNEEKKDISTVFDALRSVDNNFVITNEENQANVSFEHMVTEKSELYTIGLLYIEPGFDLVKRTELVSKIADNWYIFVVRS